MKKKTRNILIGIVLLVVLVGAVSFGRIYRQRAMEAKRVKAEKVVVKEKEVPKVSAMPIRREKIKEAVKGVAEAPAMEVEKEVKEKVKRVP